MLLTLCDRRARRLQGEEFFVPFFRNSPKFCQPLFFTKSGATELSTIRRTLTKDGSHLFAFKKTATHVKLLPQTATTPHALPT